ncbi:electron transport complex subunit RsxD [Psychrosphaera sp. F3M07]|uniref:electron transport complex subunit RsxD n=1 Tax=Psychrosphaera sp. F3M07 TaxID=2841560 RepID=UPI001C09342D|nr:electron transport complex subunit RsxD [Psychrosphaera sp. F3M07]MBU2917064.1 electron transport complex subunit RsxD [Psychrosphaera sp. F3M07]
MKRLTNLFVSSPHSRAGLTTNQVMRAVCYACLPGVAAQVYFFGWGVMVQIFLCILVALISEAIILTLREKPVRATLADGSAMLTGLLIAVSIPPLAPWWISVIGVSFAIIIVKQLYGGLGFNLFNPAMAGYVVLLISFPVAMTNWMPVQQLMTYDISLLDSIAAVFTDFTQDGYSVTQLRMAVDGITMATPLDNFKTQIDLGLTASEITNSPIYGQYGGTGWEWVNLGYLVGGLLLLKQGVIRWHIPLAVIASLFTLTLISYSITPDLTLTPMATLFSGATMFAAFFIATDPISSSTTIKGRLIFGAIVGALIFMIREWGGYPDGVAFAVLLANLGVPLIDYYTKPTVYGHKGKA